MNEPLLILAARGDSLSVHKVAFNFYNQKSEDRRNAS